MMMNGWRDTEILVVQLAEAADQGADIERDWTCQAIRSSDPGPGLFQSDVPDMLSCVTCLFAVRYAME